MEERPMVASLEMFESASTSLKRDFGYTQKDLLELLQSLEVFVPVSIFASHLAPLSALVVYLTERRNMSVSDVAKSTGRSYRAIWYAKTHIKKAKVGASSKSSDILLPMSAFREDLSIMESVVYHLVNVNGLELKEVAALINRSSKTVWTLNSRAVNKIEGT